ncbi:membrane protein insertase YidC [Rhodocytophaga rosea]|uniref:Membrane protein insertase YidC n=1 Tax=Rhodocytophaga rosea TaxID=2704465 RepID=A0A6C0GHF6_9BACT|nr:membrane protein insertase YidC [Rhodocytophaga rosea]QHT67143.1 membrane protein insertase YidC [Rhodocytophaga rosea]
MDRNQATGIMLILLLLFVYFQFFAPSPQPKQVKKDTGGVNQTPGNQAATTPVELPDSLRNDSLVNENLRRTFGDFATVASGQDKELVLENQDIKVTFGSKGARIKEVLLKNYKTYDRKPLILLDEQTSQMVYTLPANTGNINLENLYFTTTSSNIQVKAGDSTAVTFRASLSPTQYIEQTYSLKGSGFELGHQLKLTGLDNAIKNTPVQFYWIDKLKRLELDMEASRITSTINYYTQDGTFDQVSEASKSLEEQKAEAPVKWVSLKQKFFLSAIIANTTAFSAGTFKTNVDQADSSTVKTLEASLAIPIADLKSGKGNFSFYFGPNDYRVVNDVTEGFGENVYFGWPIVRIINRYFIVNVFHFLEKFISNYGIIIIILVLLIRVMLLPLSYKSYISLAKTKVLQPEIEEIKARNGDDMAKVQQEQMKLYQQVGVNPLSGCIPVLLQMPILLALFSLFPNLIELRQKEFLWSSDLSTYDSIATLPFAIPFYGSHISLFTILMTISSVAYAYFNNQMTTMQGPMKSLQYIMPIMFMFILNSLPAGLTFYYFVSNVISIGQQVVIRKFVDEAKIRRVLDENKLKNKDKKKSKFAQRLEDALKSAEEAKKKK